MIIDLIWDRKDGIKYNAKEFYNRVSQYAEDLKDYRIPEILDNGTEEQVKEVLCNYVIEYGYSDKITDYIKSVNWIQDTTVHHPSNKDNCPKCMDLWIDRHNAEVKRKAEVRANSTFKA